MLVSQNAIPSKGQLGGALPYAFNERGVLMLANILKSEQAVQVSIKTIELFVKLRKIRFNYTDLKVEIEKIKNKIESHDKNIKIVFGYIDELIEKKNPPREYIGYKIQKKKSNRKK